MFLLRYRRQRPGVGSSAANWSERRNVHWRPSHYHDSSTHLSVRCHRRNYIYQAKRQSSSCKTALRPPSLQAVIDKVEWLYPWSPSTRRHVVGQDMLGIRSKYIDEQAYTQATNNSTTTNYANVSYHPLPYNMASATLTIESNSKWRHCHLMYLPMMTKASLRIGAKVGVKLLNIWSNQ